MHKITLYDRIWQWMTTPVAVRCAPVPVITPLTRWPAEVSITAQPAAAAGYRNGSKWHRKHPMHRHRSPYCSTHEAGACRLSSHDILFPPPETFRFGRKSLPTLKPGGAMRKTIVGGGAILTFNG